MRGRHSKVLLAGGLAIKVFKKGFLANAKKEWQFLKLLKKHRIAPKPVARIGRIVVMERVKGTEICRLDDAGLLEHLADFLEPLILLDRLGIKKEECHRPDRHFLLTERGVRLIDFERAHFSKRPGNTTQFLAYLEKRLGLKDRIGKEYLRKFKKYNTAQLTSWLVKTIKARTRSLASGVRNDR